MIVASLSCVLPRRTQAAFPDLDFTVFQNHTRQIEKRCDRVLFSSTSIFPGIRIRPRREPS